MSPLATALPAAWILARVLPAMLVLPLGTWPVRVLLAGVAAAWLGTHVPVSPDFSVPGLLTEAGLGATLGLLAGLPVHAAAGLRGDGPPGLAFAGQTFAWATFFAIGGPLLWIGGLGVSYAAVPAGPWPASALIAGGQGLFEAVLLLGLPAWLTAVVVGPLAGLADRLGAASHGQALLGLRPLLTLLGLVAMLPLLLDVLRALWLEALHG